MGPRLNAPAPPVFRALALALSWVLAVGATARTAPASDPPPTPAAPESTARAASDDSARAAARRLDEVMRRLAELERRLERLSAELPDSAARRDLERRVRRAEESARSAPELPPDVVSAGEFPGSIRVPGTDAAIKVGGRIRTVMAFTLDALGSTDRFLTNSIPVAGATAGDAKRTAFSANTSRLYLEMRTPSGTAQMRAYVEGDFYGRTGSGDSRTSFRLRHGYAQYRRLLVGQTWSTFSDPEADYEALDLEGMNGENVIRQAQARVKWQVDEDWSLAAAAETPEVSLAGGAGVNLVPDLVGRAFRSFPDSGHIQAAVVLRQIRGEPDSMPGAVRRVFGWGGSLSGVVPVRYRRISDRIIFQVNFGEGNARYINDLNSLGGQDAVFDPATGSLSALPAVGWFVDYEHRWLRWRRTQEMRLRSSLVWGYVNVRNVDFQPPDAYHRTGRYSINLVYSPIPRIDTGLEFIHGTRENKDGARRGASQLQLVSVYRF